MNIKSACLVGLTLGLGACGAHANDSSSSGIGGRWRMLKSEDKQVQMVREHVRIVPLKDGDFQTTADFVFRNHGPATTATMGFPESGNGDSSPSISLRSFVSWVDGRCAPVRRHVVANSEEDWTALWVKTVHFGVNQTRHVRVRYDSQSGGGGSDGEQWVCYNFTGGNWRGQVEESVLDVQLPRGAYLLPKDSDDENLLISQGQHNGNNFHFRWTHWQAQKNFRLNFYPTFPNELLENLPTASLSANARPRYERVTYAVSHAPLVPVVGANSLPECVALRGQLWVAATAFSPRWDEERHGFVLTSGGKHLFVSALGATRRSSQWPLAPGGTFWISLLGNTRTLMIPASQVAHGLGGRFVLDFPHGDAVWIQGTSRTVLKANPNS